MSAARTVQVQYQSILGVAEWVQKILALHVSMSNWSLLGHLSLIVTPTPPATFRFCYGLKPMMVIAAMENTDHW